MAGRAALLSIAQAKSDIHSVKMHENPSGVGGTDTSAIGGAGRMGADADGSLMDPHWRKPHEALGRPEGNAKKGEQHPGYGVGETF